MKKTSGIVTAVGVVFLVGILISIESRLGRMSERLEQSEAALDTLEPLRSILEGYRPTPTPDTGPPYRPVQATGEPDVDPRGRDSARAWCPAREDAGEEWLLLDYGDVVEATAVSIRASWNAGTVTRVLAVADDNAERELWSGPPSGKSNEWDLEIQFSNPESLRRIKIVLDTAAVPGWNEIDAVGLQDTGGRIHWARKATASSSWSQQAGMAG